MAKRAPAYRGLYGDDLGPAEIARWFDEEAAYHNQFTGGRFAEHPKMYRVFDGHWLFRYLELRPDSTVLDFGCAEGRALHDWLARHRFRYVGIDSSESLLAAARRFNPEGDFRRMPPTGIIPAANAEFDAAIVLGVLHHVPNVTHYLQELARVLKPGGLLLLREPNHSMGRPVGSQQSLPGISPNERGIPAEFLVQRLTALGFTVRSLQSAFHGLLMFALRRMKPPESERFWMGVLALDTFLNRLSGQPFRYERLVWRDKLKPTATYVVAQKNAGETPKGISPDFAPAGMKTDFKGDG